MFSISLGKTTAMKNAQKNDQADIQPRLNKLTIGQLRIMAKKRTFSCRTGNYPKWLALSGSQWECRIHFILPAQGFSHVVRLSGLIHFKIMFVLAFKAISQSPQKVVISKWFYNTKRLWPENFRATKGPVSWKSSSFCFILPILLALNCYGT